METAFRCIRLGPCEGAGGRGTAGIQVRPGRRGGREAPRPPPTDPGPAGGRAPPPLGPPGPTVELEMADALALGVAGRGATEAAPQGLGLASLRPPAAAREGYRQQPQAAHTRCAHRSLPSPLARRNRLRPAAHVGSGGRGGAEGARSQKLTANEVRDRCPEPGTAANHHLQWAGPAALRVPALPSHAASSRLF